MALMLRKLKVDKNKVPSTSHEQMIEILLAAWKETDVDYFTAVFKSFLWPMLLMESEDFLVSDKLFSLIGDECWNTEESY